jgi:hypothetical protein
MRRMHVQVQKRQRQGALRRAAPGIAGSALNIVDTYLKLGGSN